MHGKRRTLWNGVKIIDKKEQVAEGSGVNKMDSKGKRRPFNRQPEAKAKRCDRCGYDEHLGPKSTCPALSRECNICHRTGHIASKCSSRPPVRKLDFKAREDSDTESDGYTSKIDVLRVGSQVSLMKVTTNGVEIRWQPDTGTQKDIWDTDQLRRYEKEQGRQEELQHTDISLYPYGSETSLTVMGKFPAKLNAGDIEIATTIYVTKEKSTYPLLSEESAVALGLIAYNEEFVVRHVAQKPGSTMQEEVIKAYPDVFADRIGKYTARQVEIMVDKTVAPVVQKARRIPVNLLEKAEDKVSQLLDQDIIEYFPDNEPRTWVSPPVIAPKPNGDIRFCIDMRLANKAVMRPFTQIPTMDDVTTKFSGAQRYSKLDLKEAYHQLELTPESRNITTFYGPDALYRYKRLNFGTKSAQDILQIEMQNLLAGIPNQVNLSDDILIGGSAEEHEKSLRQVLTKLNDNGITLNTKKCTVDVEEVGFVGLVFNAQGIKPDPKNVWNLKQVSQPTSQSELRSFMGMAGYSMTFIPNFAQIAHPLRELAKGKRWSWPDECQAAFEKLKKELSDQSLLNHYVPGRETELVVDASLTGLGAVLVQRASRNEPYHSVMYKSRSLKEVETRYSATEREGLAIRWAVTKLRKFLLGAPPFTVVTDHKPLEYMFNKTTGDVPPRI